MKIIEFMKTADTKQLCDFMYILLSGCECCGDCPMTELSEMKFDDEPFYDCTTECIMHFLNSEMSDWK